MNRLVSLIMTAALAACLLKGQGGSLKENPSPVNLAHALSLVDSLEINGSMLAFIWIYAEAPHYQPVPAADEGITCVDDVGRFMEVLETEILTYENRRLLPLARGMTRFLLYLSREDGLWYNFMLADGSVNTVHPNSRAEFGWWAVRGLRGLASAYRIFINQPGDSTLLEEVRERITACQGPLQKVLENYPQRDSTAWGLRPAWLIKHAPDMNSELLIALTKLHNTGDFDYRDAIEKISAGILEFQYNRPGHDLHGMYLCWQDRWHNWGNNQAYGLLEAYKITGEQNILNSVRTWADSFTTFLVDNDFPWEIKVQSNQEYTLTGLPQIAYGMNSIYRGLKSLDNITPSVEYQRRAERVFNWFTGNNGARMEMYRPESGRCYDGIGPSKRVNMNSGAESTIECLLAIQLRGSI